MDRRQLIAGGAACALLGFFLGRVQGPPAIEFPDPDEARSAAEMQAAVSEALTLPRAFPRAVTLARLFEGLSPENVSGAAAAVAERSGRWDPVDLQLFLGAWVELDPRAAARAVHDWPIRSRREMGLGIVIREWAASGRAIDAVDYVQQAIDDPRDRSAAVGPLVRGWALSGDLDGALGLARRIWDELGQREVVDGFARGLVHREGADGAIAFARALEPTQAGELEQHLARVTMNLAGRESPAEAASFYADLEAGLPADQTTGWMAGMLDRVAAMLRRDDVEGALRWLLGRRPGTERDHALTETMGAFATLDLDRARDWFERERGAAVGERTEPGSADEVMLIALVRRMARVRPSETSGWLARIGDDAARADLERRLAFFWALEDERAARAWVATLPVPATRKAALEKRMDEALADAARMIREAAEARGDAERAGS